MPQAICVKCGSAKKAPWKRCKACGFAPATDTEALVRSVYLSVGRFDSDKDRKAYEAELTSYSERLRSGETIKFEVEELARLRDQRAGVESVTSAALVGMVLTIFLPGILFLLALYGILAIIKLL